MPSSAQVNGLILAGGRSTRMGTDKGLLDYHGVPQREFLSGVLRTHCQEVFISCREEQRVPENLRPIVDSFKFAGPLNGILSAFQFSAKTAWLAVAVDMPFVNEAVIENLLVHRDTSKLATCYYNPETKQPEPLLTVWEKEVYPQLEKFVKEGNFSPREFLKTHPVNMIEPPDAKVLLNFNYPQDLSTL